MTSGRISINQYDDQDSDVSHPEILEENVLPPSPPETRRESSSSLLEAPKIPYKKPMSAGKIIAETIINSTYMGLSFTGTLDSFFTSYWIARLKPSSTYLAAANLTTTTYNITTMLPTFMLAGMGMLASKEEGKLRRPDVLLDEAKRKKIRTRIANIYKGGLLISGAFILPVTLAGTYLSKEALILLGQDKEVAELVGEGLRASFFAVAPMAARFCAEQMMFGFGHFKPATAIALVGFGIGTGLAYTFAYPLGYGIPGIFYGYGIEALSTAIGYTAFIAYHPTFKDIHFFGASSCSDVYHQAKKISKVSSSFLVNVSVDVLASFMSGLFSGWLGKTQQAAQNFSTQLSTLSVLFAVPDSAVISQEVGRLIGEGDYKNAERYMRIGSLASLGKTITLALPFAIKPDWWAYLMANKIEWDELRLARKLIPLDVTRIVYDTAQLNMIATLRATGDIYLPTAFRITCLAFGVLGAYLLGSFTSWGVMGVTVGLLLGIFMGYALTFPRWAIGSMGEEIQYHAKKEAAISFVSKEEGNFFVNCLSSLFIRKKAITTEKTALAKHHEHTGYGSSGEDSAGTIKLSMTREDD